MLFEAMFVNRADLQLAIPVIGAVGIVIGLVWLRRVAGSDPDREPSTWRYRKVRTQRQRPTAGWLATRAEMALAMVILVVILIAPAVGIGGVGMALLVPFAPLPWILAVVLAATGTVWIFRIARGDPEAGTPPWRYRDR